MKRLREKTLSSWPAPGDATKARNAGGGGENHPHGNRGLFSVYTAFKGSAENYHAKNNNDDFDIFWCNVSAPENQRQSFLPDLIDINIIKFKKKSSDEDARTVHSLRKILNI